MRNRIPTPEFCWKRTAITLQNYGYYTTDYDTADVNPPENGADLTSEQQNSLTEALNKVYQSITSGYTNDKGEMYYFYSGLLKLTGNLSYTEERELARYKDWIISDITTSLLLFETNRYYVRRMDDDKR